MRYYLAVWSKPLNGMSEGWLVYAYNSPEVRDDMDRYWRSVKSRTMKLDAEDGERALALLGGVRPEVVVR